MTIRQIVAIVKCVTILIIMLSALFMLIENTLNKDPITERKDISMKFNNEELWFNLFFDDTWCF